MSDGGGAARPSRMKARSDDPWLSVHAIAEYTFCPRAGLIAYENRRADPDDEPPAFDTLPRFELQAVEAEIAQQMKLLFRWLWAMLVVATSSPISVYLKQYWYLVLAGVAMIFITWQSLSVLAVLQELHRRRRVLLESRSAEPDPFHEQMQPVNWFGLLNLGFQSQVVNEPLRDGVWNFEGKPWRLLIRGDLVIPVFRTRSAQESPREPQVAKCMAYCRLVSVVYERECPYGIILTGEDYSGFAIPYCEMFRRDFHNSLVALRHLVQATGYGRDTEVDYEPRKCSGCHLGRPRSPSSGERVVRFGAPVPVKTNRDGMHSDCGDRFEWEPPYSD
ncbi:hypothetical protein GC176_02230 [bacterium]|nr:hypothetical protein [bacterium]